MNPNSIESKAPAPRKPTLRSPLLLTVLALGGGYLIWNLDSAGSTSGWLWLLLLACPLMHFLMPHGHGGAKGSVDQGETNTESSSEFPDPSTKDSN